MEKIKWVDDLLTGIPQIDNQHKELFLIAKKMAEVEEELDSIRNPEHLVKEVYQNLVRYSREHFALEEKYMENTVYPKSDEHRQQHQQYIDNLGSLGKKIEDNPQQTLEAIIIFVKNWWASHILLFDMELVPYLKKLS